MSLMKDSPLLEFAAQHSRPGSCAAGESAICFVYLVPVDRQPRASFAGVLEQAVKHLRKWTYDAIGRNTTFKVLAPAVSVVQSPHPALWYSTNASHADRRMWFWLNVASDAFAATGGSFGDVNLITIAYVDARPDRDQLVGGAQGLAVLPQADIEGLLGEASGKCRWVGGLGHELGHAVGLQHPLGCDGDPNLAACRSLMYLGYADYPATFLDAPHIEQLILAPTFARDTLQGANFDCGTL